MTLALLALLPPHLAGAEDLFHQTQGVACFPDGVGCTTFQGYIYVHRPGEAASARVSAPAGGADAQLGEQRLYLHIGAADSP
jgi:hypothetical protein